MHRDSNAERAHLEIEVDALVDRALGRLARSEHVSKSRMVERILLRFLEDQDDYKAAAEASDKGGKRTSHADMKRAIGLAD